MSEQREASVKLTLDNGQFITSVRKAGDEVAEASKKGAKQASSWTSGLNGAKSALSGIGNTLKRVIGAAAGLGAAFSLGAAVQKAVSVREQFRDIEFQINKTGRASVSWKDLLEKARQKADETGQTTEAMGKSMESVFAATGDAEFAVGALESVGHTASATGKSVESLSNVAQVLQRKFGATLETLPDMMAVFAEKTDAGGLSLDAMGAKFGLMAGEAADAGFRGADGLSSLLGMMEMLDSRIGEKAEPALKKLFQVLKTGSRDLQALSKESGVKFADDMTGIEKLRALMATKKGRGALQEKLTGELRVVYDELAKPFNEAFESARKSNMKEGAATQKGIEAFDASMMALAKRNLSADTVKAESKQGQLNDPRIHMQKAMERFTAAFHQPEMLAAIDSLADSMPALAKVLAQVVQFAVKHPILAGAGAVAATAGGGMVKGILSEAVWRPVGGWIGDALKGTMKGSAEVAGGTFAKRAFATAGIVGAAGLLAAGIVEAIAAHETAKFEAAEKEREEKVIKKGRAVQAIIKEVAGMTEEEAVQQYGEQGRRFKSGKLTAEERTTLEEMDKADRLGIGSVDRDRGAERGRSRGQSEFGLDEKLGIKPGGDIMLGDVDRLLGKPEQTPAKDQTKSGPNRFTLENEDSLARSLARALSQTRLRVEVSSGSVGDPSRGALPIPPTPS